MTNIPINGFRPYQKGDEFILEKINHDKTILSNLPFNRRKSFLFLINNQIVGFFNVDKIHECPEIQYAIFEEYRNQGYGTFLLNRLTNFIFISTNCQKIYLMINKKNLSSIRVAQKNGYKIDEDLATLAEQNDVEFPYYNFYRNNPYYLKNQSSQSKKSK